jgi:hypothetical protein
MTKRCCQQCAQRLTTKDATLGRICTPCVLRNRGRLYDADNRNDREEDEQ